MYLLEQPVLQPSLLLRIQELLYVLLCDMYRNTY